MTSITSISKPSITMSLSKGVSLALTGYLCMALMSVCAKGLTHLPTAILIFAQFSISLLLSLPSVIKLGLQGLKTEHPWLMSLRASTALLNIAAMLLALRYIPLVNAVVLQNTAPLFVPFILLFWLRKKIATRLWVALLIGFLGVIFIVKPSGNVINIGTLIGLSSGLFSALSMTTVAVLKYYQESTTRIMFYMLLIGVIVSAPFLLMYHNISFNLHDIWLLLALGVTTYFASILLTHAFAQGSTHVLAALSYSTVAFAGVLGLAIWGHVPDWISLIGILCVSLGGILAIFWKD